MTTKCFASAGLMAIALLGSAFAGDEKAYSGAICKAASATDAYKLDYSAGFSGLGVKNTSASTVSIVCPVEVDSLTDTSGTGGIKVFWTASNQSHQIVCALKTLTPDGSVIQAQFGSRIGTGPFVIPNVTQDDRYGPYSLDCQLPAGGLLNSIWINENGTT